METNNRIREEWEEYSFKGERPEKCEMICDHIIYWCGDSYACNDCGLRFIPAKWANSKIAELLKSQAEQLEGIYGFSPDDWEKKKQELLKSQKESLLEDLEHEENHFCKKYGEQFKECAKCYIERKLSFIKQSN